MIQDEVIDLVLDWEEQREAGIDASPAQICRGRPHLVEPFKRELEKLNRMSWLDDDSEVTDEMPTAESQSIYSAGMRLGHRFRLDRLIGVGGFGEVWRGYDVQLRRPVAVKLPKRSGTALATNDPFLREAQNVSRLQHPNIIPIFDVGQGDRGYYIISAYVEAKNLADHVKRHAPTIRESAEIIADIADALNCAHLQGFVHRDVKPANILIDRNREAYLTDFGIAAPMLEDIPDEHAAAGTMAYMAPEQWLKEKQVSGRIDIYSLGVVFYELLTGRLPFPTTTPEVLRRMVLNGEAYVEPSKLNPLVRDSWNHIIKRCLQREQESRFSSASELANAIRMELQRTNRLSRDLETPHSDLALLLFGNVGALVALCFATRSAEFRVFLESPIATWFALFSLLGLIVGAIVICLRIRRDRAAITNDSAMNELLPAPLQMQQGEWSERIQRVRVLRDAGVRKAEYLPALVDMLNVPSVHWRKEVADLLVAHGPLAVKALIQGLRDNDDSNFRQAVITTLGLLGPDAKSAVGALRPFLQSPELKSCAQHALAGILQETTEQKKTLPLWVILAAVFAIVGLCALAFSAAPVVGAITLVAVVTWISAWILSTAGPKTTR